MRTILAGIRCLAARLNPDPAPDGELLARFLEHRDEAAFAELVSRHAAMVFGTCRRVLGNAADAEDAFQAAFVVLVRRAHGLTGRACVGNFLYGVAFHTALKAKAMAAKRRAREARSKRPAPRPDHSELLAALDEELAKLPEKYREPVVMCELEGRSRRAAAAVLGVAEGTISSRLAVAHRMLEKRLRARGVVAVAAAALLAVRGQAVADSLARAAVNAVVAGPPPGVSQLATEVTKMLLLQRLGVGGAVAVVIAAVLAVAVVLVADAPPSPAAPVPQGPGAILICQDGVFTLIDADGKNVRKVSEKDLYNPGGYGKLSPDGKRIAVPVPGDGGKGLPAELHVRALDEAEPGTGLGVKCDSCFWSPDGTEILCESVTKDEVKLATFEHTIVNVKTKETTALKVPADHHITDWSADGKLFLTLHQDPANKGAPRVRMYLLNRDGTEHKVVTDGKLMLANGKLSPDGSRVLCIAYEKQMGKSTPLMMLAVVDVATGKVSAVKGNPLNAVFQGYCWSPDGKKIAYTWVEPEDRPFKDILGMENEAHLVVSDPDGANQKTILSRKGEERPWLRAPDWR